MNKYKLTRSLLALALLLAMQPHARAARQGQLLTVVAGTPIQLATRTILVKRILIQMQVATGGGVGYVMAGVPLNTTPTANTAANPTIQLGAGTSTAPGGSYVDQPTIVAYDIDLQKIWVDGAHSGDPITVTYETAQ